MRISHERLKSFAGACRAQFIEEMSAALRTFAPGRTQKLSDRRMRRWLDVGIARAEEHGFRCRGPVRCYLEATLLLGIDFAADPLHSWAHPSLASPHYPDDEMDRALDLCHALNRYITLALRPEWQRINHNQPYRIEVPQSLDASAEMLRSLAPERCAFAGDERLAEFVRLGAVRVDAIGIHAPRERAVVLLTMFRCGCGWLDDPQYPWAPRALSQFLVLRDGIRPARPAIQAIEVRSARWLY